MTADEIHDILRTTGAVVEGHFEAGAGMHTDMLLRPVKATQFAPFNRRLCYEIVRHFLELDIHVVVAASPAAIPVAVEVGRQLEARALFMADAPNSFTDRPVDGHVLFDGFEMHEGERVIIMENMVMDDAWIDAVSAAARAANARIVGVGSIIDARPIRRRFTLKDVAAIQLTPALHAITACPLCGAGIPLGPALTAKSAG